jgi:hypothetical protein
VIHTASPDFWLCYRRLPVEVRELADKNFSLLKANSQHPALRLKRIDGTLWSARVGPRYRALAWERQDGLFWFWIGPHDEYELIIRAQ